MWSTNPPTCKNGKIYTKIYTQFESMREGPKQAEIKEKSALKRKEEKKKSAFGRQIVRNRGLRVCNLLSGRARDHIQGPRRSHNVGVRRANWRGRKPQYARIKSAPIPSTEHHSRNAFSSWEKCGPRRLPMDHRFTPLPIICFKRLFSLTAASLSLSKLGCLRTG